MRKKIFWIGAVLTLFCVLAACGGTPKEIVLPKADPPPPAEEEMQAPAISGPVQGVEPTIPPSGWSAELMAYTDILEELYQSYQDPERFRYEDGPDFALYDVDRDGLEELIVRDPTGEVSGQWVRIYGYDGAAGEAYLELLEYPNLYYYDNGVIEAYWSHSQGAAGDKLWPYTLYQYDPDTGLYDQIAMIDGWDRDLTEVLEGKPFPEEADQDGDGFVYFIMEGDYVRENPVDGAAYESWRETWLNGAFPCGPSFLPLVRENIDALGQ